MKTQHDAIKDAAIEEIDQSIEDISGLLNEAKDELEYATSRDKDLGNYGSVILSRIDKYSLLLLRLQAEKNARKN